MKYIAVLLLLTVPVYGQDVTYLEKDKPAPYSGYLFTPKKEKELRLTEDTLKYCDKSKELTASLLQDYENINKTQNERLAIRDTQIDTLSKRLVEEKDSAFLSKLGFFILGALVTTGIAYGVTKTVGR